MVYIDSKKIITIESKVKMSIVKTGLQAFHGCYWYLSSHEFNNPLDDVIDFPTVSQQVK